MQTIPSLDLAPLGNLVRDGAYVAIGASVLGIQRLQVRRRELTAQWNGIDGALDTFEVRLDQVVAAIEDRLPAQAGTLVGQVHETARTARRQVRQALGVA